MTTTTFPVTTSLRSLVARQLATTLERARTRHALRSDLAREIAAYPATASAAMVVLPTAPR